MKLLELLQRESTISVPLLALTAAIAGLSNAAILALINTAAAHASTDTYSLPHALLFVLVLALYIWAQRYLMLTSSSEIEKVLNRIRLRVADKLRYCDLLTLEHLGRADIYASLSKETQAVSQSATVLVVGAQSAILVFFTVLYIAWLSLTAFVLSLLFTSFAVSTHFKQRRKFNQDLHQSMLRENQFFESLTDMLDGFKEIKINRARSADLFEHLQAISASATALKIKTQSQMAVNFIFSQTTFYLLLATVVFVVPQFSPTYSETVIKTATAVLFLIGPISSLVGSIPMLAAANAACENIVALEERLERSLERSPLTVPPLTAVREIRLQGVFFYYTDRTDGVSFSVGPLDLALSAGEILFVVGGNGSGKSTFMKLLTGLYRPTGGVVLADGMEINATNSDAYRQLFSVIFTDYHLFKRLYGLPDIDPAVIDTLLKELELERKTRFIDGEFQTLDLSTGQKKRLALLVALLEDKPVYVFDEWAADQDPSFRRKFYEELLPRFKARGKTVVAVTHDDRYYGVADRVMKMEEGRMVALGAGHGP